jgi:hypothetical protein
MIVLNYLALALICLDYGLSWPVRGFLYLDMFNIYRDVIRWKDVLDTELSSFAELEILCSTMLEWRLVIYASAFHIFWVCVLFRYVLVCYS